MLDGAMWTRNGFAPTGSVADQFQGLRRVALVGSACRRLTIFPSPGGVTVDTSGDRREAMPPAEVAVAGDLAGAGEVPSLEALNLLAGDLKGHCGFEMELHQRNREGR